MAEYRSVSGSSAEDLFIELFADTFGADICIRSIPSMTFIRMHVLLTLFLKTAQNV